ncbi:MAG: hypothetical protein KF758_19170 [Anaerolineales bacterium]|nr:hypothetical protein [Anaerolineales bacterium]
MAKHAKPNHSSKKIQLSTTSIKDVPRKITLTSEQSQILGQVYQLILGWRRERLDINKQTGLTPDPIDDSKNIQSTAMEVKG